MNLLNLFFDFIIILLNFLTIATIEARRKTDILISANDFVEVPTCARQFNPKKIADAQVTFIIPSKGRHSLVRTLESLLAQTQELWAAIIVYDGILSNSLYLNNETNTPVFTHTQGNILNDGRFCFQYRPASYRESNCAADIRNFGIAHATTDWVAFVDDDDTLKPEYVQYLLAQSAEYPKVDAVLFRMCQYFPEFDNFRLIPDKNTEDLVINDVGISFAVRRELCQEKNYWMKPSNTEDYLFLDRLYNDHFSILLSKHNTYKVKDFDDEGCNQVGKQKLLQLPLKKKRKYAKFVNCSVRPLTQPTFFFSEEQSIFFQHNIKGLKYALLQTMKKRCFSDSNPIKDKVHIIFSATEKPASPYYIQVQLEQRNSFHFTPEYRQKLSNALQIWDFNIGQSGVKNIVGVETGVYFIPTMLTMYNTTVYKCPFIQADRSAEFFAKRRVEGLYPIRKASPFMVYRYGKYYTCEWSGKGFNLSKTTVSSCYDKNLMEDEYCWKTSSMNNNLSTLMNAVNPNTICMDVVDGRSSFDVLSFGLLSNSYNNQREMICDQLSSNGINALCIQGVFRKLLNHLVCISKVIVVTHYFKDSALETHRIDPLLKANKAVIATTSSSSAIEYFYANTVRIVSQNEILSQTKKILTDMLTVSYQPQNFVEMMSSTFDPLCFALANLAPAMKLKEQELKMASEEGWLKTQSYKVKILKMKLKEQLSKLEMIIRKQKLTTQHVIMIIMFIILIGIWSACKRTYQYWSTFCVFQHKNH